MTILQRLERVEHQLDKLERMLGVEDKPAPKCKPVRVPTPAVKSENKQGQAWSDRDDHLLWSWRDVGKSYEDIAEVLGRTTRACQCRWSVLNCSV